MLATLEKFARHMGLNSDRHEASSYYAILLLLSTAAHTCSVKSSEVWQRRQKWARLFTEKKFIRKRERERKSFPLSFRIH